MTDKPLAIIGCDPGVPVALALVGPGGELLRVASYDKVATQFLGKWTNEPKLAAIIMRGWKKYCVAQGLEVRFYCEQVNPMPGEGVVSVGKFVGSMWMMRGIAAGLGISDKLVSPQRWKKMAGLPGGKDAKEYSRRKAIELWFGGKFDKTFLLKKSHNIAEAALIGLCGLALANGKDRI